MTPHEVVLAYAESVKGAAFALRRAIPWVGRVGSPGMLMGRTVAGDYLREGNVPGLGSFSLHGAGCLVQRLDGGLIDFDWDQCGREVFDPYRIRRFGRSIGAAGLSERQLRDECRGLVRDGVLEEAVEGWFALAS